MNISNNVTRMLSRVLINPKTSLLLHEDSLCARCSGMVDTTVNHKTWYRPSHTVRLPETEGPFVLCSLPCPGYTLNTYMLIEWPCQAFVKGKAWKYLKRTKAKVGLGYSKCSVASLLSQKPLRPPLWLWNLMMQALYGFVIDYVLDIKSQTRESKGKKSEH